MTISSMNSAFTQRRKSRRVRARGLQHRCPLICRPGPPTRRLYRGSSGGQHVGASVRRCVGTSVRQYAGTSVGRVASIHRQDNPGHPFRLRRQQESNCMRDIVRLAEPERMPALDGLNLLGGQGREHLRNKRRHDHARGNRIDPDLSGGPFDGQRSRQARDGAFRGRVSAHARRAHQPHRARHQDNRRMFSLQQDGERVFEQHNHRLDIDHREFAHPRSVDEMRRGEASDAEGANQSIEAVPSVTDLSHERAQGIGFEHIDPGKPGIGEPGGQRIALGRGAIGQPERVAIPRQPLRAGLSEHRTSPDDQDPPLHWPHRVSARPAPRYRQPVCSPGACRAATGTSASRPTLRPAPPGPSSPNRSDSRAACRARSADRPSAPQPAVAGIASRS